jgi:hypothetical protein
LGLTFFIAPHTPSSFFPYQTPCDNPLRVPLSAAVHRLMGPCTARARATLPRAPRYDQPPPKSLLKRLSWPTLLSPLLPLCQRKSHQRPLFDSSTRDTPLAPSTPQIASLSTPIPFVRIIGDRSHSSTPGFDKTSPPPPCHSEPLPVRHSSSNRLVPHSPLPMS